MRKPKVTVRIEIPDDGQGHEDAMVAIAKGLQYMRAESEYEGEWRYGQRTVETRFNLTVRYDDGRLPFSVLRDALQQVKDADTP